MGDHEVGVESLWRLNRQTTAVTELSDDLRSALSTPVGTPVSWPGEHRALAGVLADELAHHRAELDSAAAATASVESRQRTAIAESAKVGLEVGTATSHLAAVRDRLLQAAVVTEVAEEIEDRLGRRLAEIRATLS